jgi:hypothetical protein
VLARCSRDSARRRRSRSVQRVYIINSEISGLSKIAREKRKRRKKSVVSVGKRSCAFSEWGTFSLLNPRGFSFCPYIDAPPAPPLQTNYVRVHRATTADPGEDAGGAGTARAPAADAKGPKARWLSPHPRSTGCARNTSLTSGVECLTTPYLYRRRVMPTLIFFPFAIDVDTLRTKSIPYHPSIIPSLLCSLLTTSLGSSFTYCNRGVFLCLMK